MTDNVTTATEWPRRRNVLRWTVAERAINDAMQAVERMGADVSLTDAVVLLSQAQARVADYVDAHPLGPALTPPAGEVGDGRMFGARPVQRCAEHGAQRFEWHEGGWRCQVCGEPASGPVDVYALLDERDALAAQAREAEGLRARVAELEGPVARPESEWHEDLGPVVWWKLPVTEPPYVGTPGDSDWPADYYTHWTPLLVPANAGARAEAAGGEHE